MFYKALWILRGIDSTSRWHSFWETSINACLMFWIRSCMLECLLALTFTFILRQRFSMGVRSGQFPASPEPQSNFLQTTFLFFLNMAHGMAHCLVGRWQSSKYSWKELPFPPGCWCTSPNSVEHPFQVLKVLLFLDGWNTSRP